MTDADYTDNLALLANTPLHAKCLLHNLDQAARSIGLNVNTDKSSCVLNKIESSSL